MEERGTLRKHLSVLIFAFDLVNLDVKLRKGGEGENIRNSDSNLAGAPPPRIHTRRTQRGYAKGGCAHDGAGTETGERCIEVEEGE